MGVLPPALYHGTIPVKCNAVETATIIETRQDVVYYSDILVHCVNHQPEYQLVASGDVNEYTIASDSVSIRHGTNFQRSCVVQISKLTWN